ncbi:hybrid sensor histidine kinase/response regulator [Ferrimonas aestuarii]|uniref:histidine kinase n=1 Tax=Ferrimonas aestuarii TaxID=2569539 RepID=A0A4U1BVR6_9GAMM|nr:PAS domain-containing hybrid sensor histidine kinase/response regulator [Ferrimonas aestuarii]TKB58711.1 response regulator [Ferrimonas aestuarii]
MTSTLLIGVSALIYLSLLFAVAWGGERFIGKMSPRSKRWVYGLSLAVYCSSWSFLGTVGQASRDPWGFLPIYIGPILLFSFGFGVIRKLILVSKQQNITSVADFIAARYGKSQLLAALVTLIAVVGIMPYIALQLKAMVMGFGLFQPQNAADDSANLALVITLALAVFSILFGTRKLDATEHNPGLMLAIAFESVLKLVAFVVVGAFVVFGLFDGPWDLLQQGMDYGVVSADSHQLSPVKLLPETLLTLAAFLCLPRMFHVMVVECQDTEAVERTRWTFPIYLLVLSLFVLPIAIAGGILLPTGVTPDSLVITLPLYTEHFWIAAVALLGMVSAATGMVVVAVVTLSIMVSNEWLVPLLLRSGKIRSQNFSQFSSLLLNARRITIVLLLLAGLLVYQGITSQESLARLGILAFGAFAQLSPALIGGLYWKRGNRGGVLLGLAVGFTLWFYVVLNPQLAQMMGAFGINQDVWGLLLALLGNGLCYWTGSLSFRASVAERIQTSAFVQLPEERRMSSKLLGVVTQQDLLLLASRFVGPKRAYDSLALFDPTSVDARHWGKSASLELIAHTEKLLSSVLGASSADLVMDSVLRGRDLALDEVFSLMDEASAKIVLSQDMLRGAIENAYEGISVIDGDLKLVAWNKRYQQLYGYPEGFLEVGMEVAKIIRFNAERGFCGPGDIESHVQRRVQFMRQGSAHSSERQRSDGRVVSLRGNPMPGGGFVMTFTDITDYRHQQEQLESMNATLEARVEARTQELETLNAKLMEAKEAEQQANQSKSRFLAAIGHDLMQPLNAARLFTAALGQDQQLSDVQQQAVSNISGSLHTAGDLLSDLLDISKLESGTMDVNRELVDLSEVLTPLITEFSAIADNGDQQFKTRLQGGAVFTDASLLRRIVQNFLTNALKFAPQGKVLLATRVRANEVEIQVWDNGCGIAEDKLDEVFYEFKQLNLHARVGGVGLGLAIVDRISKVLGATLKVRSILGAGSVFSVTLPRCHQPAKVVVKPVAKMATELNGIRVLCIDNEVSILTGLTALLERWRCQVVAAESLEQAVVKMGLEGFKPDIILADYHLDDHKNGLDAMDEIRRRFGDNLPGVLISADNRESLKHEAQARGYRYMAKMVKPAALRAMVSALIVSQE